MKKLDPKAVWLFFVSFVLRWFIMIFIASIWIGGAFSSINKIDGNEFSVWSFVGWLSIIIPIFLILCFIWAKLTYRFYRYESTDLGFRKESGVIYKKYVTIPYDRIQNVDIYRGILARILGLSDLNIQTAGSGAVMGRYGAMGTGAEGRLPALSKEVAEKLRDELLQRARQSRSQSTSQGL